MDWNIRISQLLKKLLGDQLQDINIPSTLTLIFPN